MSHWRPFRDREIVEYLDQGIPPKEVAMTVGVSVWTVYRAIRATPLKCEKCGKSNVPYETKSVEKDSVHFSYQKTIDLRSKIDILLREGQCIKEIAKNLGVSLWAIYRAIRSSGVSRPRTPYRYVKRILSDVEYEKSKVRSYTKVYVRRGKIEKKPCEVCGEQKAEIHHLDYSDPFLIKWLCFKHHRELHRNRKAQKYVLEKSSPMAYNLAKR